MYILISFVHFKLIVVNKVRPKKKICVFPVTRPTLIFPSDPKVFIGIPVILFVILGRNIFLNNWKNIS